MWWIVGDFVVDIQIFYGIVHRGSCILGDVSILTVPWCIYLWGCLFVLFYLATGKFHLWYEELWGEIMEEFIFQKYESISKDLGIGVQVLLVGESCQIQQQ